MIRRILGIFGGLGIFGVLGMFPVMAQAATLTFNPASGSFNKGCEVEITINLDTQGVQTDGTDVIVLYSPSQLTTSTSQITNGSIYPEYPGKPAHWKALKKISCGK